MKMDRRDFLKMTAAGTLGLAGGALAGAQGQPAAALAKQAKPNILFIFSDQQRPDTMGCYGQQLPVTPNFDKLAAEGVRFEHNFTCQPVCGPARAALQTGMWATQTGCFRNGIALPQADRTMAHYLADAGYEVGYLGKWHLASGAGAEQSYINRGVPPEKRGGYKDYWLASDTLENTSHGYDGHMWDEGGKRVDFPAGRYRVDAVTDYAIEYLKTRDLKRPFFLFMSYLEPHHQNDHNRFEGPTGSKEKFAKYEVPKDLEGTQGDWRANYPDYLGSCNSIDQNFGRLRAELERRGILENTLIIYTSDHGCHFRTRNAEYKRSCHEASIHTPLIVRGPGFKGGKTPGEMVSLIDLTPTVLTAAGVQPPPVMVGTPLQPLVVGQATGWRDTIFVQISEDHIGRALRTTKWKYEVWVPKAGAQGAAAAGAAAVGAGARAGAGAAKKKTKGAGAAKKAQGTGAVLNGSSDVYHEYHLYDLEADPAEKNDLVADPGHATIRAELAKKLKELIAQAGERPVQILPAVAV